MRRVLIVFLLAFLPLHFSWAAVAAYCGHEAQAPAGHVGHHEHAHAGDTLAKADAPATPADAGAVDLDCGQCHGHCALLPSAADAATLWVPAAQPGPLAPMRWAVPASARPERPQWHRLA